MIVAMMIIRIRIRIQIGIRGSITREMIIRILVVSNASFIEYELHYCTN